MRGVAIIVKLLKHNSLKQELVLQNIVLPVGVIACLVGICVCQKFTDSQLTLVAIFWCVLLGLAIALFWRLGRANIAVVALSVFVLASAFGACRFYVKANSWSAEVAAVELLSGTPISGTIDSQPLVTRSNRGTQASFQFSPDGYSGNLRVSWYRADSSNLPQYGEIWRLPVRIKRPDGFDNAGVGRYSEWLAAKNTIGRGYLSGSEGSERLVEASGFLSSTLARERLSNVVGYWLGERPARPVIQTLVTGEKLGFSDALKEQVRKAGLNHLLAISGLHIGIAAALGALLGKGGLFLCGRLAGWRLGWWAQRSVVIIFSGLVALAYAWISGFAIPTQRALLMLAVVSFCLLLMRTPRPFAILLWVLLIVVLVDPMAPLLAGFWLSFAAVSIILLVLSGRKYPKVEHQSRVHSALAWFWRQTRLLIRLQIALSIGLMPLTVLFFSQVSVVSPAANLVAVPLFSFFVVPIALMSAVAGSFWQPLGAPLIVAELLARFVLQFSEWLIAVADAFAASVWVSGSYSALGTILLLAGLLMVYFPKATGLRWPGVLLIAISIVSPHTKAQLRPAWGEFRLTMLDVGHGLAIHLQTASHDLLYDTAALFGSGNSAANIVIGPYLRLLGLSEIDLLVVSHSDNDHAGGVAHLEAQFQLSDKLGWQGRPCLSGQGWNWDGVEFSIVSPNEVTPHKSNDQSCVILLKSQNGSVLITGDVERRAERKMLESLSSVDLLVVPHHGSKTSSHPEWLERLSPKLALVSSANKGRFDLPHGSVLNRYRELGIPMLQTRESGSISVLFETTGDISLTKSRDSTPWWLAEGR